MPVRGGGGALVRSAVTAPVQEPPEEAAEQPTGGGWRGNPNSLAALAKAREIRKAEREGWDTKTQGLAPWLTPGNPGHNHDRSTPQEKLKRRAQTYVQQAKVLRAMRNIVLSKTAKDRDKIEAARLLIERGYGLLPRPSSAENEETPRTFELVIRKE